MLSQCCIRAILFSANFSTCYTWKKHLPLHLSAGTKANGCCGNVCCNAGMALPFFPLPNPLANVYSDASESFGSGAFVESLEIVLGRLF